MQKKILAISVIVGILLVLNQGQTPSDEISWDGTWIDTHAHLSGPPYLNTDDTGLCTSDTCVSRLLDTMDTYGIALSLIMHTPAKKKTGKMIEEEEKIQETAVESMDRLAYVGGGGILNPFLQLEGEVTDALKKEFEELARGIAESGAYGFGEMAALHLSISETHPFEQISPDNELLFLLADLAAEYKLPIDLHMDPVVTDLSTPTDFLQKSSKNPPILKENIIAFERLLSNHRNTKIVWAHVGRNHLGKEQPELYRRLLFTHPNLFLQMDVIQKRGNSLMDEQGNIMPDWLQLMNEFPDRFVMGSDTFYGAETIDEPAIALHVNFLSQLPGELVEKIAIENAKQIYSLDVFFK